MWVDKEQRINQALQKETKTLELNYKVTQKYNKLTADIVYKYTMSNKNIIAILQRANSATKDEKKRLRDNLFRILKSKYEAMKQRGVLQYHFLLPDNTSFLRMHKKDKYGDYLGDVRYSHKYVNETKKPISGFEQGRIIHGFRNVYPIIDSEDRHLGSVEVSFNPTILQKNLTEVYKLHSHFIIHKGLYDVHKWNLTKLFAKYKVSYEHNDYFFAVTNKDEYACHVCTDSSAIYTKRDIITKNMDKGVKFAVYSYAHGDEPLSNKHKVSNQVELIAFLPIKNIKDKKSVAYLVSYQYSNDIKNIIDAFNTFMISTLMGFLVIFYFVYKQVEKRYELINKNRLLQDILDSSKNIAIVTDFDDIKFTNSIFLESLNIENVDEFNHKYSSVTDIFVAHDGCLHQSMLEDDESFYELVNSINPTHRVVGLSNRDKEIKLFHINITKTSYDGFFLITLNDITAIKKQATKAIHEANHDSLTGVYNRKRFNELLEDSIDKYYSNNTTFVLAIIDIDHFKRFNDIYGHLVGDEVLILLARHVQNSIRREDTFARWGGEEFVILLDDISIKDATKILEHLRVSISKLEHPMAGHVTASMGLSEYQSGDTSEALMARCDEALYKAKESGRNRVCIG
jgi:diguanylate cyclase (GGDEF)-like protein